MESDELFDSDKLSDNDEWEWDDVRYSRKKPFLVAHWRLIVDIFMICLFVGDLFYAAISLLDEGRGDDSVGTIIAVSCYLATCVYGLARVSEKTGWFELRIPRKFLFAFALIVLLRPMWLGWIAIFLSAPFIALAAGLRAILNMF